MKKYILLVFFLFLAISYGQEEKKKSMLDSLYSTSEIIVTGTRTAKKIIDIPFSVNYLDFSQYKFNKNIGVNDVLKDIPGVQMQSRYGNHDVKISIRGFGSRSNSGIRGVRILLDGIPESEPDGQTRIEAIDFDAVGKIEIVKGNSSSLYTNAPGGVINFINNNYFPNSFIKLFSHTGSFGLLRNGFKLGLKDENYSFLTTYSYHNYTGYREHSQDYWHILNSTLQVIPNENSRLNILFYYANGIIKLPGSLTLAEYESNSNQAAASELKDDYRRVTKKGRIGISYNILFGKNNEHELEFLGYGTIKYFDRVDTRFRIMNRYGLGGGVKYVNKSNILNRTNEFALGADLFTQAGPIEKFEVSFGNKTDKLKGLTDETLLNVGLYFQDSYELLPDKFSVLLTGRYDNIGYENRDKLNEVVSDKKYFRAFTPKIALNYKINPIVALFTSFGLSFDSPAFNELDNYPLSSNNGSTLINPDLEAQKSKNFEIGTKGSVFFEKSILDAITFELTTFYSMIENEIVPFEINGSYFYRNSAKTNRFGIEAGADISLLKSLRLKASYTLSQFKYKDYSALTYDKNYVPVTSDYSGNFVPSVPKHLLIGSISYDKEIVKNLQIYSNLGLIYSGDMFVNDANSDKTESYSLLDFGLGFSYSISKMTINLGGGVNNILDKKYVAFININSLTKRFYESGLPRNFYLNLSIERLL